MGYTTMSTILDNHFLATYYVESKEPLEKVGRTIASMESTGGWSGEGQSSRLFLECDAHVAAVRETAPGKGEVDILFPTINLNMEDGAYANLWLTMIGGGTHALLAYDKSRLMDFRLPPELLRFFPGPAFGPEGTRQYLDVQPNELIIGTIVKPTAGLTPDEVADRCYKAALGGVRFIKDDEKMLNACYCPLAERVKKVSTALQRAQDKTGKKVLYAPHITADPQHLLRNAETALEQGANGLMVNFFAAGFTSLSNLRQQVQPNVPIYAHCGGKEAFGRAPGQGVDPRVVVRFARLLGGDYFRVSTVGGYLVGGKPEEVKALAGVMAEPLKGIKPMMAAVSGGLNPETLGPNLEIFGTDAMMLAGSGITTHPMGVNAGTVALQQAAEAFQKGLSVEEYARSHKELRLALKK